MSEQIDYECSYANGGRGCRLLGRFELWSERGKAPDRLACDRHLGVQIDLMHVVMDAVRVSAARYVAVARPEPNSDRSAGTEGAR